MRWLRNTIVVLGTMSGLAMVAGGCDYDDHHHDHDHWRDERPAAYRYDPYYRHDGYRDRDWDRRYDRDWDHDRDWHHDRW